MYIIRSITMRTSFLLHKNSPDLILGGYIIGLYIPIYPPTAVAKALVLMRLSRTETDFM